MNYRLGHELNAELRKAVPWRVLLEADGYGMVATQLLHAGVDYEEAMELAKAVHAEDADAERRVDEILGAPQ